MKAIFVLLLTAVVFSCTDGPSITYQDKASDITDRMQPDSLLRHAVFFSFTEESTQADVDRVQQAFSALPGKIREIHSYEWGTNNSPEGLDKGFTHAFFVTFLREEDREVYLPHPAHLAFVEVLQPHVKDVFVFDYWARDN